MKFLITVEPNTNLPPPAPEQTVALLRGFIDELRSQLSTGQLDCAYATGQNRGIGIAEASTVEEVWARVIRNPMSVLWHTEVIALADPIQITETQLKQLAAAQPVAVGRN